MVGDAQGRRGCGEILTKDLLEWLAEWGRDFRRKQTGLLLLTAHRAKGLEFDHAVVLDGGWDRRSRGEDRDAARRLYYVAMTRAKQSLTLMSHSGGRHAMRPGLSDRAFLIRNANGPAPDTYQCMMHYHNLDLSQIDLSFAGRLGDQNPSLEAIQRLRTGDPLSLARNGDRWLLLDGAGRPVGRLAQNYEPPSAARFVRGQVSAVIVRRREDSDVSYQRQLRREEWEVVVPELIFGTPRATRGMNDDG